MNITGTMGNVDESGIGSSGAFYRSGISGKLENKNGDPDPNVYFDASRSWTGSTSTAGSHAHKIGSTGKGTAFDVMPPYIVAYVWRRTA